MIEARIRRWLRFGTLADTPKSLVLFGTAELRPFLELAFRYTRLPLAAARVTKLRISTNHAAAVPADVETASGERLDAILCLSDQRRTGPQDVLLLRGTRMCHVYRVPAATGRESKLVVQDLGQALSVYVYFYHTYCKGSPRDAVRSKHACAGTNLLFAGVNGGPWRNVRRDVCRYVQAVRDPGQVRESGIFCTNMNKPISSPLRGGDIPDFP